MRTAFAAAGLLVLSLAPGAAAQYESLPDAGGYPPTNYPAASYPAASYPAATDPTTGYPSTGFPPPALLAPPATISPADLLPPPPAPAVTPLPAPAASPAPAAAPTPTPAAPLVTPVPPLVEPAPPAAEPIAFEPTAVEPTSDEQAVEEKLQPVSWYRPQTWFRPDPWDVGFELGINGSTGTSESTSVRTGGYIKRETDLSKLDTSLYYNKTSADGEETQSNALFKGRHDWMFGDSPWTLYASNQVFYDEFQAFDLNVNINGGLGYKVFDAEWVKLTTSFGAGAAREFGGPVDRWAPEAQFGFDWEQSISKSQRFYAKADYFPGFEDFGDYRVLTDMGLEIDLACPSSVSLKLSAQDRFDSRPEGVAPHNTNYSVLLLWKR